MDLIKRCFYEKNTTYLTNLEQEGFSDDLVEQFLPETAEALLKIIASNNLEKNIEILLSNHPAQLLNSIDTHVIAKNLAISSEQVTQALEAIAPEMTRFFTLNSNQIVAETASLAWKTTDKELDPADFYN